MINDKKSFICFNKEGDVFISYYSQFGERIYKLLEPSDRDSYLEFLLRSGLQNVLDKYNLELIKK